MHPNSEPPVLVTGSIAYDTVLEHAGRFADALRPEALDRINLTFSAARMRRDFGGCAANIARALSLLGGRPVLWSALGQDASPYLERFRSWRIEIDGLLVLSDAYCAQCFITTDRNGCQLTTFHPGALARADEAPMPEVGAKLAILSPGECRPMLREARLLAERGIPFIFDPGQAVPLFAPDDLRTMIDLAAGVAFSDYEATLIEHALGLKPADLAALGKNIWHTHGAEGSSVWLPGTSTPVHIEPVPVREAIDPVGAGDAYRGGVLFALARGLDPVAAARLGTLLGAAKVAVRGAQTYEFSLEDARRQWHSLWGKAPF